MRACVVPPHTHFERRELDLLDRPPEAVWTDQLGLVESVHGLGESVIKRVVDGPGRGFRAELLNEVGVDHDEVVRPVIGLMDQGNLDGHRRPSAIFSARSGRLSERRWP